MSTFGLVHGAFHGAWCWGPLSEVLEARGHHVLTVDLPTEDPDAGAEVYAATAIDAFATAGDDLVVVGHSLGGLSVPLVAQARPVSHLVYLCAMLPRPGRTQDSVIGDEPDMIIAGPDGGAYVEDGVVRWQPDLAEQWFFADCTPEQSKWAAAQLRGQCWRITQEVSPLRAYPDVPCTSLVGAHDTVISSDWSMRASRAVLGVEPVVIEAGHSPFLSATSALADLLIGVG